MSGKEEPPTVEVSPNVGVYKKVSVKTGKFRRFYLCSTFPIFLSQDGKNNITWKVDINSLDFERNLVLFFHGLCETTYPYNVLASKGISDMLDHGGSRIVGVIPQLITPIKNALKMVNEDVFTATLKALQHLIMSADDIGRILVEDYSGILLFFKSFRYKNAKLRAGIGYRRREDLAHLIQETLEMLERRGGEDAFRKIKERVPTYESCLK